MKHWYKIENFILQNINKNVLKSRSFLPKKRVRVLDVMFAGEMFDNLRSEPEGGVTNPAGQVLVLGEGIDDLDRIFLGRLLAHFDSLEFLGTWLGAQAQFDHSRGGGGGGGGSDSLSATSHLHYLQLWPGGLSGDFL